MHPANVHGLIGAIGALVDNGNSLVVVDHDVQVLRAADQLVEMVRAPATGAGASSRRAAAAETRRRPPHRALPA